MPSNLAEREAPVALKTSRFEIKCYGSATERHDHDHHQLVLPLKGVLDMEVEGSEAGVTADRAAAVQAGQLHSFAGSGENAFLVVDVPELDPGNLLGRADFWSAVADKPFIGFEAPVRGFCEFLVTQMPGVSFEGLRAEVAGDFLLEALSREMGLPPPELSRPLARARAFIESNFREPLTLAAVAEHAGLSESRLSKLYKARFGLTPGRQIARLRLGEAASLLAGTALPIAEIAFRVGYGDQSAFTRAFQREIGETPADYRDSRQNRHKER